MEQLQEVLIAYNNAIPEENRYSWSKQYLSSPFPRYWQVVFSELAKLDRSMRILEIGAGQGDVTSIGCYLGFKNIMAYERNPEDYFIARDKVISLFGRDNVMANANYINDIVDTDILILVNCVYVDDSTDKEQYMSILKGYYESANFPRVLMLEVIDRSYTVPDSEFPMWVRLSEEDIASLFPNSEISFVETYRYPQNKKSKKLYIIKHNS